MVSRTPRPPPHPRHETNAWWVMPSPSFRTANAVGEGRGRGADDAGRRHTPRPFATSALSPPGWVYHHTPLEVYWYVLYLTWFTMHSITLLDILAPYPARRGPCRNGTSTQQSKQVHKREQSSSCCPTPDHTHTQPIIITSSSSSLT